MTNVVSIAHPRLGQTDFCFGERIGDGSWPTYAECWTTHPLEEVLRDEHRAAFLKPMQHNAKPGDMIEVFRVSKIETPEADPLEMATLVVAEFKTDRTGTHMRTEHIRPALHFGSSSGRGIEERHWRGKASVFVDGKRVGAFNTLIEAVECAERLRLPNPDTFSDRVNARLAELRKEAPAKVSLPVAHRCRREDIAHGAPKKISRELTVRLLDPIADVLAVPQYFGRVVSVFRTGDRVTFIGFDSDAWSKVTEILHLALADVSGGRVRFYPQGKPFATKYQRETGCVLQTIGKETVIRRDGRKIESFASRERAEWFIADHNLQVIEKAA